VAEHESEKHRATVSETSRLDNRDVTLRFRPPTTAATTGPRPAISSAARGPSTPTATPPRPTAPSSAVLRAAL
jgi:hypothetical protein